MCNQANQLVVEEVINDLIDDNKAFTAFDVTQEARQRGATEFHGQMKRAVHAHLKNAVGYTRSLVDLYGVSTPPYLYHADDGGDHVQVYADEFKAKLGITDGDSDGDSDGDTDGVDTSSIGAAPSSFTTASPIQGWQSPLAATQITTKITTKEGRLSVPNTKWGIGVSVNVYAKAGSEIRIVSNLIGGMPNMTGFTQIAEYKINKDGRLRIGAKALRDANLHNSSKFNILKGSLSVSIKPA